jgi:uncharacterized protein (DUF362 family)
MGEHVIDEQAEDKRAMGKHDVTRRGFMKRAIGAGLAACGMAELIGLDGLPPAEAAGVPTIVVASKKSPAQLVQAAMAALGGMESFVKRGARVLVKPNMAWARRPEQAATTNPEVVAEVVRLCKQAGAREVKVLDHAVDRPDALILRMSGIEAAARKAGGRTSLASSPALYERVRLPRGKALKSVKVLRDLRRADVLINVPIAKVHSATGLTLGCKNLMGAVWDRGAWHRSASLDQAIADFAVEFRPDLVILDAVRVLLTNGPKGPGRTETRQTLVAGDDPLAVDAYGATLLGHRPSAVGHLRRAHEAGVGEIDLDRIKVKHV